MIDPCPEPHPETLGYSDNNTCRLQLATDTLVAFAQEISATSNGDEANARVATPPGKSRLPAKRNRLKRVRSGGSGIRVTPHVPHPTRRSDAES